MFLDPDLIRERVQPGGRSVGLRFLPLLIFVFLHWLLAGLDRGRLHLSDTVPSVLEAAALVLFVARGSSASGPCTGIRSFPPRRASNGSVGTG